MILSNHTRLSQILTALSSDYLSLLSLPFQAKTITLDDPLSSSMHGSRQPPFHWSFWLFQFLGKGFHHACFYYTMDVILKNFKITSLDNIQLLLPSKPSTFPDP